MRYNLIMVRNKKMTTAMKILMILDAARMRCPLTEREIIDVLRPAGCSKRWGNSYFLKGFGNRHEISLIKRGLIDVVGIDKGTHARMYRITDAGRTWLAKKFS